VINSCTKSATCRSICAEDDSARPGPSNRLTPLHATKLASSVRQDGTGVLPRSHSGTISRLTRKWQEKSTSKPVSQAVREFCVPIANIGSWAISTCAGFMRRFRQKEAEGKRCVLLSFTDHDPGGLHLRLHALEPGGRWRSVGWSPRNRHRPFQAQLRFHRA
jgi:hypothetical protein